MQHWKREFEGWTDINVVVYHGTAQRARHHPPLRLVVLRRARPARAVLAKFDVLLTTYEMLLADEAIWHVFVALRASTRRTGSRTTPASSLQAAPVLVRPPAAAHRHAAAEQHSPSSGRCSLLDRKFASARHFLTAFGDARDANQVAALHAVLRR
jgi:hypothetical protein